MEFGEGWYVLPGDFVQWATTPPAIQYINDKNGVRCFCFAGTAGYMMGTADITKLSPNQLSITYVAMPDNIENMDPLFKNALIWNFLENWGSCQNSIAQFNVSTITPKAMRTLQSYVTVNKQKNISLGGLISNQGYTTTFGKTW
jgi:hypothetical protein